MELALALVGVLGIALIAVALALLRLPALPGFGAGRRIEQVGSTLLRAPRRAARRAGAIASRGADEVRQSLAGALEATTGVEAADLRRRLRVDAGARAVGRVAGRVKWVAVDAPTDYLRQLGPRERRDPVRRWAIRLLLLGVALLVVGIGGLAAWIVLSSAAPLGAGPGR